MAIYPTLSRNPSLPLGETKHDSTIKSDFEGGYLHTRPRFTRERGIWELNYNYMFTSDKDTLSSFVDSVKGAADSFYWANQQEAYKFSAWQASQAYSVGDIRRPTTVNGRSYICTVAGTSDTSEPTWPTSEEQTVVDGGVTWKENSYTVRFKERPKFENILPGFWNTKFTLQEV